VKKDLLLEGAVAGHMNHIYDNGEMTFGELKQLLQSATDGKLRGTEKTDGQNVYLSFDVSAQKALAIRNKTHILAGGLDIEQFDNFFSQHPNQALRYSFVEALQAFEDIVKEVDKETQLKIFGQSGDNIYFNAEVMNPGVDKEYSIYHDDSQEDDPRNAGTTNVIPYDKKTLLIHEVGHDKFHPETALSLTAKHLGENAVDLSPNYELLERALMGKGTDEPGTFSVETHPQRKLEAAGMEKASEVLGPTVEAIDNLVRDFGLNDANTIQDLVMTQIEPIITNFGLTEDRNKLLVQRLMRLCRSLKDPSVYMPCGTKDPITKKSLHEPRPKMKDIVDGIPQELKDEIKDFDSSFKYQDYTAALSNSLYDFTNAILQDFHSSFISDNEGVIKKLQDDIANSVKKIQDSSNEAAKEDLVKQLAKLKGVENINTPSEGFVFDFNNTTYKFTGWFAPSNQILGTERYGRFGPITAPNEPESGVEGETEPLTIGVVPGAFKPPHKGHLTMVEALAAKADKVIVVISTPTKDGRTLPSGKTIDSDHAVQIWNAFLDASPAGRKTVVIKSPAASPVGVTYDFVMKEPNPTDQLVAPPNSTVLLGCGDKEDDKSRYDTIIAKAKETRGDLNVQVEVCELTAKHSSDYLDILKSNPAILERLPSNTKTNVSIEDLHASDMRYIIDVAAADPVGLLLLQDFVPSSEDALAVMGILGLNAADERGAEEDQVEEPELDANGLKEMINNFLESTLREGFKSQKAPKAGPSKSKFQKKMRKRLSKAHATYLDMGNGPKGHHGGGFRQDRKRDISNAFLAEEELEEMSSMAGGNVVGYACPIGKTEKKIKEEEDMNEQEQILRKSIRIGLQEFFDSKKKENEDLMDYVLQEHQLRLSLRNMIVEGAAEDPTVDVSDSTGINTLKDLLKNSNVLSTLRNTYKTLTTDVDQKRSFRAHVVKWIQDTLAPVRLNDLNSEEEDALPGLAEASGPKSGDSDWWTTRFGSKGIGVDIDGVDADTQPGDADKLIDADDGSADPEPVDQEEEETMAPISGADTTGRNKAERIYPTIEKSIVDYYGELDNPEDQEMFYDYLIANTKLYFDKWDGETSKTVEEPTNDEYKRAKSAV